MEKKTFSATDFIAIDQVIQRYVYFTVTIDVMHKSVSCSIEIKNFKKIEIKHREYFVLTLSIVFGNDPPPPPPPPPPFTIVLSFRISNNGLRIIIFK